MVEYRLEEPDTLVNVRAKLQGIMGKEVTMRLYFESPSEDDPGKNLSSEFEGHFKGEGDGSFSFVYSCPGGSRVLKHSDKVIADMHPVDHKGKPLGDENYACIRIELIE